MVINHMAVDAVVAMKKCPVFFIRIVIFYERLACKNCCNKMRRMENVITSVFI